MGRNGHVETIYKYALVILLLVVLFNLGQALFFMMTDKGQSKRTVWALTRRIGLSLLLIAMVALGIFMGWLHPMGSGNSSAHGRKAKARCGNRCRGPGRGLLKGARGATGRYHSHPAARPRHRPWLALPSAIRAPSAACRAWLPR